MRTNTMVLLLATAIPLGAVGSGKSAHAVPATTVRLCTGKTTGNYYKAATFIKQQLSSIEIIETKGSVDNLERLAKGECDAAIAQSDAVFVYEGQHTDAINLFERARDMYPEQANLVCNEAVDSSDNLHKGNTVLVDVPGSGTATTWEAFVKANPKHFGDISTLPLGGTRALSKITDGVDAQCMLFVAGLNSPAMKDANQEGLASGKLHLAEMRDSQVFQLRDPKGRPIYEKDQIPSGTYRGLQPRSVFGSSVPTIKVQSALVGNLNFISNHDKDWEAFLTAVRKAMPAINDAMTPK